MEPALRLGDRLLVLHAPVTLLRVKIDDIVILRHPRVPETELVKRVAAVVGRGPRRRYIVLGDNCTASTDSRTFGPVSPRAITGRVLLRYWPDERRGVIPPPAVRRRPRGASSAHRAPVPPISRRATAALPQRSQR